MNTMFKSKTAKALRAFVCIALVAALALPAAFAEETGTTAKWADAGNRTTAAPRTERTTFDRTTYNRTTYTRTTAGTTTKAPATTAAAAEGTTQSLEQLREQYEALDAQIAENEQKLTEIEYDINSNEAKLDNLNSQIDTIKRQINLLNSRIEVLNGDIGSLQTEIGILDNDIDTLTVQIKQTTQEIEATKEQMSDTETQVLDRLRAAYMSGEATTLEILFTSPDLSTFLTRKELISRVTENDRDLIEALEDKATALSELERGLGEQKSSLEGKKSELDSQLTTLVDRQDDLQNSMGNEQAKNAALNEKYAEVSDILNELDESSEAYQAQLARQKKDREEIEAQIDAYINEHGSSVGDIPLPSYSNDGKMTWPVPYSNTHITAGYPYYSDGSRHGGIDIVVRDENGTNISNGKNIVAAQGGEVIYAISDNGYNGSYGNYLIIDHGDGKLTLYAHCKRVIVKKGDIVKKGQKVAEIGLTGNTTGYHLHFEVRIKDSDGTNHRVNPLDYVSKPSN